MGRAGKRIATENVNVMFQVKHPDLIRKSQLSCQYGRKERQAKINALQWPFTVQETLFLMAWD